MGAWGGALQAEGVAGAKGCTVGAFLTIVLEWRGCPSGCIESFRQPACGLNKEIQQVKGRLVWEG